MKSYFQKSAQCLQAILSLALAYSLVQCKPADKVDSQKSKSTAENQSQDLSGDEKIDIPSNIAGSYLTCALRKEAKDSDPEQQYGCMLTDQASKKKLELGADSHRLIWSSNIKDSVTQAVQPASSLYHVYFSVRGASPADALAQAKRIQVIASWTLSSGVVIPVKQEALLGVLKPAVELEDFEAPIVREQMIEADRPGSL